MKRLSQLLATLGVAFLVPLAVGEAASAVATCDVGFTGPNSQNMCTSVQTYQCTVTNTNNVTITNSTDQTVYSGAVSNTGNTSGGGSTSGTATNSSGTTFSVSINNGSVEVPTCTATVVVPATDTPTTVTPTTTNTTPSGGGGAIKSLPVTSQESPLDTVAIVTGATVVAAVITAGGAVAYRHVRVS